MKRLTGPKAVENSVFVTLLISIVFIASKLITGPSAFAPGEYDNGAKSKYALMALQCVIGMIVLRLPGILQRKLRIKLPECMVVVFAVFLYCGIFLGEVRSFYYRVPHWDTMLHIFSGFALGVVGLSVTGVLNSSKQVQVSLSPAFAAIFAFCFAVAIGSVWEIYEFIIDGIGDLNMQKYAMESGAAMSGRAALADTMKDLIVDTIGALTASVTGYLSMKREGSWLARMQIQFCPPEGARIGASAELTPPTFQPQPAKASVQSDAA